MKKNIMTTAWQFINKNGFSKSDAVRVAWLNVKLLTAMRTGIVRFVYRKVDGSLREAYGTLAEHLVAPTQGTGRKPNPSVFVYFDTEKQEYRCFKKANLVSVAL